LVPVTHAGAVRGTRLADLVFDLHQQVAAQSVETQQITNEVLANDNTVIGLFAMRRQLLADDGKKHILIARGEQQSPQLAWQTPADGVGDNPINIAEELCGVLARSTVALGPVCDLVASRSRMKADSGTVLLQRDRSAIFHVMDFHALGPARNTKRKRVRGIRVQCTHAL